MRKPKPRKLLDTPEKQHARFVEPAKQAEADESSDALDGVTEPMEENHTVEDR
jgi:hypothetical protein